MTIFNEALAVRTHCKRVAWKLAGQQVHGLKELLTNNMTPDPGGRTDSLTL
jgi:hypothetical protein